jgi:hypothetical protein
MTIWADALARLSASQRMEDSALEPAVKCMTRYSWAVIEPLKFGLRTNGAESPSSVRRR